MKIKFSYFLMVLIISTFNCTSQNDMPEFEQPLKILVFSKTDGYRHTSISAGIKMLFDQNKQQNWVVTATEDPAVFTDSFLAGFDVAVFLNPSGNAIHDEGQVAFEKFMKSGKGFVGIHAAADHEYDWPFYGELVGAYFKTHPPAQQGTVIFESYDHPAMEPFKGMESYTTFDEWYTYRENPRNNANVLAVLDENSIKEYKNDDWRMGDHPLIWWNDKDGIRSFYTVFGHTAEAFQDEKVIVHIKNAINWAGRRID